MLLCLKPAISYLCNFKVSHTNLGSSNQWWHHNLRIVFGRGVLPTPHQRRRDHCAWATTSHLWKKKYDQQQTKTRRKLNMLILSRFKHTCRGPLLEVMLPRTRGGGVATEPVCNATLQRLSVFHYASNKINKWSCIYTFCTVLSFCIWLCRSFLSSTSLASWSRSSSFSCLMICSLSWGELFCTGKKKS